MTIESTFHAKLQAPPANGAQWMRDHRDEHRQEYRYPDRDSYRHPERDTVRRNRHPAQGPRWPYDEWPLPFASFWTSIAAMGLAYPVGALLGPTKAFGVTLVALVLGLWLGVRLDRWLRRHPAVGGPRMRWVLGVG